MAHSLAGIGHGSRGPNLGPWGERRGRIRRPQSPNPYLQDSGLVEVQAAVRETKISPSRQFCEGGQFGRCTSDFRRLHPSKCWSARAELAKAPKAGPTASLAPESDASPPGT